MKLSKLLVSCVAVGALAAACTTAAFADEYVKAEYKDGKVTLSGFGEYAKKVKGDFTLLILSADDVVTSENANTIITQIDQFGITDGNYTKEVTVGDLDTTKTYYVRLGGAEVSDLYANGFVATTFGGGSSKYPYADCTQLMGDVNNSGIVDPKDLVVLKKHIANVEEIKGTNLLAADVNDSGIVDAKDLVVLKKYTVNPETYPFTIQPNDGTERAAQVCDKLSEVEGYVSVTE